MVSVDKSGSSLLHPASSCFILLHPASSCFILLHPAFFGREREMQWLQDRVRQHGRLIVISGPGGVGKTTLLRQFLDSASSHRPPLFFNVSDRADIAARVEELYSSQNLPEIVAIDYADLLDQRQLEFIAGRILNLKAIRALILVSRRPLDLRRAETLQLGPLDLADAHSTLKGLLGDKLSADLARAAEAAKGFPLLLEMYARLIRERSPDDVQRLLRGEGAARRPTPAHELVSQVGL